MQRAKRLLESHGHRVILLEADEKVQPGDVFIALHCDGLMHKTAGGAT